MSIPIKYIDDLLNSLSGDLVDNLIAQVDSRRILQEVKESLDSYPTYDSSLTVKIVHIAYSLISCGCSKIENQDKNIVSSQSDDSGLILLEKGGKLLSDCFLYNETFSDRESIKYHQLIAGMALYASRQYSQAFINLKNINVSFNVGTMIINFIKKDFSNLIYNVKEVFISDSPDNLDMFSFDEWVISHEIARCFLIIIDYIYTGREYSFDLVDKILRKLLLLATEDNMTSYWMIIRLLMIIFSTFRKASLWYVLSPLISDKFFLEKYIQLLTNLKNPIVELWPSQIDSIPLALNDNEEGAVINLRTSAGKTRVAEIAMLKVFSLDKISKVLYLAPFRSLAFEIEKSLKKIFQPIDIEVSQLYGGATANTTDLELIQKSQIIIATPEKTKALIRSNSDFGNDLKLIIIDEGHLLGPGTRLIRNEIFLTHIKAFSSKHGIRILLLSAVLPNSDELAQWIANDSNLVAKSKWKPSLEKTGFLYWNGERVNLNWNGGVKPFNPNFIVKKNIIYKGRKKVFPNNFKDAIIATALRLAKNGTVMIYSARANSIKGFAESALTVLGDNHNDFLWDSQLWKMFKSVCEEELGNDDIVLKAAQRGIICHNNNLPGLVRITIEKLMRSKPPLIIIASSTLAQGVNIGISTVIVFTPYISKEKISNRDFWNICGRAGRAFSDIEGKILYAIDGTKKINKVRKDIFVANSYFDNNKMEKVKSGLWFLLKDIYETAQKSGTNFNLLLEAIACDSIEEHIPEESLNLLNLYFDFIDDELLAMHEDFSNGEEDYSWVEDVFRKSLAIIQAEESKKELYINILKARTQGLKIRFEKNLVVRKLTSSGVPLSVSESLYDNVDFFRNLVDSLLQDTFVEKKSLSKYNIIIREIEEWSILHAKTLIDSPPELEVRNIIRINWLMGSPLFKIIEIVPNTNKIVSSFYGFTLPWIIHAISQMFNSSLDIEIKKIYSDLAMFIELGLPNKTAVNIFMSGVRSRRAAVELSKLKLFHDKTLIETKKLLLEYSDNSLELSVNSKIWLDLFKENMVEQVIEKIDFPHFSLNEKDCPKKLYPFELNGDCYLISQDGYFIKEISSTDVLPFYKISNIFGLYFQKIESEWVLKSYNPKVKV